MASRWPLLVAIAGCGFTHGAPASGGDGSASDATAIDTAPADAFDAKCFGPTSYKICLGGAPAGTIQLSGNLDTSGSEGESCASSGTVMKMSNAAQTLVCVVAADRLQILASTTVSASGDNPLVLLAGTAITIAGTLDVSSRARTNATTGANANATRCSNLGGRTDSNGGGG